MIVDLHIAVDAGDAHNTSMPFVFIDILVLGFLAL